MITVSDITTDFEAYAHRRSEVFRGLVPLRRARRVRVGDLLSFDFENLETIRTQIQEMIYVERVHEASAIQEEIDAYSRFLPDSHSLVATMLIELDDPANIREVLTDLAGIQLAVSLQIGDLPLVHGQEISGPDEDPDALSDTVSVHMLRFTMSDEQRDSFRDPTVTVELLVEHIAYDEVTAIAGDTRLALLADLAL